MNWIYLSPHPDDVALSCGGLIWEQTQANQAVSIWTICAGSPPEGELSDFARLLHQRWETGVEAAERRRQEDQASAEVLGAMTRHFSIPDCIYRLSPLSQAHLYPTLESLFGSLHADEAALIDSLSQELAAAIPPQAEVVAPLAIGNHVDHQLTRLAVEQLGRRVWYYPDYPYVLAASQLENLKKQGWAVMTFPISEAGLQAWERSIAMHASQVSTFWLNLAEMRQAIRSYAQTSGGVTLWRPAEPETPKNRGDMQ